MALTITHIGEPHAGREIRVGDEVSLVTFGRATDATVAFPIELDTVSRDHFQLRRELGVYKFVISREKPVYAQGRPLIDGEELDKVTEIQLSGPGGPRLKIERQDVGATNYPKTRVLKGGQDIGDIVVAQRSGGRRLTAGLGIVAILVGAVGAGVYFLREDVKTTQAGLAAVTTELPSMKDAIAAANEAAAARMDSAALMSKAHDSIYHVQIHFASGTKQEGGTASVIMLPDGRKALATNAHVAQEFIDTRENPAYAGAKVVVVQPVGPDYPMLEVTDVKIHPGYAAFQEWGMRMEMGSVAQTANFFRAIPAYDVALLYVAEPEKLGPALPYASREAVLALKSGDALFTAGYPSEGLAGTDITRPEPTSHTGVVTSVTTFYLYHGASEDNQLVQHSAPVAGGASGSPMLNAKGEVVALVNAINLHNIQTEDGARVPSAALVNYAQRADLLFDLMDDKVDALMPKYRAEMAAAEARLQKTPEAFLADLKVMIGQWAGDQNGVSEVARETLRLDRGWEGGPPNGRLAEVALQTPDKAIYMLIAMSADGRPVQAVGLDADGRPNNFGMEFTDKSFIVIDNRSGEQTRSRAVVIDYSSLGGSAVETGSVNVILLRALPPGGAAG